MGVGVLIFNENNELLIVKPSYKDHWSIPGGVIDENESPRNACIREVKEDYTSPTPGKGESLQLKEIHLTPDEISEYQFLPIDKALPFLSEKLKHRIPKMP